MTYFMNWYDFARLRLADVNALSGHIGQVYAGDIIHPCHTAAILSRETKKALFYHAKPRSGNHGGEAWRGKTKLFWSPRTIWLLCDKGEL